MCIACEKRRKTWTGDDPKCGFPNDESFDSGNWNCATLNSLRSIAEKLGNIKYMEDISLAVIPVYGDEYTGWIVLSWYKSRGRTSLARFISDSTDIPLTLEIAQQALQQYKDSV
jgi:hypothetical protein